MLLLAPHRHDVAFVDYVNTIGTNLQVLLRCDETSGATTSDKRTGGGTRTGTFGGSYVRNEDTALEQGTSRAAMVGRGFGSPFCLVNTYSGSVASTFTYAMVVRFSRQFNQAMTLVGGAGTGWQVEATDLGSAYSIRLQKTGGGVVTTGTATISDVWKDHLIIVSMGGSTASTRIVIDGVLCTGTITTQTAGAHSTRVLCTAAAPSTEEMCLSAYAEWTRQLTAVEEANLFVACRFNYRPRHMLHGIHSGLSAYTAGIQQPIVDATSTYLRADMARFDLRWNWVQTTNGGAYNWTKLDSAVDAYVAAGITPLVTIVGSPTWRTGGANEFSIPAAAGFASWVEDYFAFVTAAVVRYKNRVKHWEIWNEPNYGAPAEGFWRPMAANTTSTTGYTLPAATVNVSSTTGFATSGTVAIDSTATARSEFTYTGITATSFTGCTGGSGFFAVGSVVQQYTSAQWGSDFASLCNALRVAIVAADPTAKVCTGGILGYGAIGMGLTGRTLLIAAVVGGLSADFTYYGLHPYHNTTGPRAVLDFENNFDGDIRRMRDDLISFARPNTTIWATEYGYYFAGDVSVGNIAATNTKVTQTIEDLMTYHSSYVDLFCYFVDFDRPNANYYGVLTGYNAAGEGTITGLELSPKVLANTFKSYALTHSPNPPELAANFDAAPTAGDAPLDVTFTDTSTNAPTEWLWDFGD